MSMCSDGNLDVMLALVIDPSNEPPWPLAIGNPGHDANRVGHEAEMRGMSAAVSHLRAMTSNVLDLFRLQRPRPGAGDAVATGRQKKVSLYHEEVVDHGRLTLNLGPDFPGGNEYDT